MSITPPSKCCPKCGGPIPAEAPEGLCPRCVLLQASLPTEAGKGAASKSAPPTQAELAHAFPQLDILELIGQGGMGFVFKARQSKLDRFVALKILPQSLAADPAFAERFTREARMLARLSHPNIVTLHDFGQANGFFYLLMEFVDGVNLRQAMKVGRFTPAQALSIVPKICEALEFAHNEGILHRDVKPENILLDTKGRVKIADFGIAKLVVGGDSRPVQPGTAEPVGAANLTETGKVLGTPHYMAPEQIEHPQDLDQRADIYSLGVVFYEMLTGELPLGRFAPPSERSAVDPRVDDVVLRTLEKERERRTKTAGEVKTQVEGIVMAPQPGRSRREETAAECPKPRQDWWTWSPLQSPEVSDICAHLTKAERAHMSLLGLLFGVWIPGTCFGIPALIKSFPSPGNWIVASVWLVLFAVSIPMLQRLVRHFLCSTNWAKERGFTPEQLRLFSFRRANLWKVAAVLIAGLVLILAQHKAITRYLGLSAQTTPNIELLGPPAAGELSDQRAPAGGSSATVPNPSPPAASAETWSPEVAPSSMPELYRILEEAKQQTATGHYEEALQRYLWFHNHEQEVGDPYADAVRLTSALSDWEELSRRYPKAKQALIEIRDNKTKEIAQGRGYSELFRDVQAINHELQDDDATYALFKTVREKDPKLAGQVYGSVEPLLVSKGEYQWCLSYIGDPQGRFDSIRQGFDTGRESQKRMAEMHQRTAKQMATINQQLGLSSSPPDTSALMKKFAENRFVGQTCQLIEVLVATGRKADAERIRDQAVAILDDPRLKSAIGDVEEQIQKRSLRTGNR